MIYVNLLPHHLRPIKRTPVPYILSSLVLLLALLGIVAVFLQTAATIANQRDELAGLQAELTQLADVQKEFEQLQSDKQVLARIAETIDEIVSGRIIWSRQLFNLSRLAPENFWYTKIATEMRTFREQVVEIDPKTKEPRTREVSVRRPVLIVAGYVLGQEGAEADVSNLMARTSNDPEFATLFTLEQPQYKNTFLEGYPVKEFELVYQIAAQGGDGQS